MNEIIETNNKQLTKKQYKYIEDVMEENLYPSAKVLFNIVKKEYPDIKLSQIQKFVNSQEAYQLTKQKKETKKSLGHIISYAPFSIVQIDLIDLSKYSYDFSKYKHHKKLEGMQKEYNKGYKYLFIFIDVFSRYVDAIMLKDKGEDECLNAIKLILSYNKINPKTIMSDSESAFLSSKFINFLESKDIKLEPVVLNNHHALGIIDRFCRTLKSRLTKLFLARKSTEWINDISNIIYQYNNTENRGILNFTPQEVISDKEKSEKILNFNIVKQQKNINLRGTSNIKEGDKVRLYINDTFKKGTEQNYTTKSYNVVGKKGKNILLDNGQKVVESNLLKINNGEYLKNSMMIDDGGDEEKEELNILEETKKQNKIKKKLKKEDLVRPTVEEMGEGRQTRKKQIDFKKLNRGY